MEAQLVAEFISRTGANPDDALSCLKSWGWNLKKALIDYNDTSTTEYFNGRAGHKVSMDENDCTYRSKPVSEHLVTKSIGPSTDIVPYQKSSLIKTNSVDVVDYKKLYRGISRATDNVNLVSRARSEIAMDFHASCQKAIDQLQQIDTPEYTFTLPDITVYPEDYRKFLEKDLIECSTLNALESAHRLNWWADSGFCRKLWPLSTTGDGNCLLHAASLAMWGFHDRKLTLRAALYNVLSAGEYRDALWRRWRFQQTRLNRQAGFVYSEVEWAKEWDEIVSMASTEPRQSNPKCLSRRRSVVMDRGQEAIDEVATYESLEEVHIFALSHVLRRTIIVISDTVLRDMNGEAMAPIPFGGVYLPFEIPASECHRSPLLLTYDMAHFSALVSMEAAADALPALIPLTDVENVLLPIQFCIDPGKDFNWKLYDGSEGNWTLTDREHIALLKEYLDIVYATPLGSPEEEMFEDLTDEEFDRRMGDSEIAFNSDENQNPDQANGKSKAAKQLQNVAKQFGSIGKSMSKKIKKNIGSITKIGGGKGKKGSLSSAASTQSFTRQRILCGQLKAKRHDYQEEMIKNYLECAQERFRETSEAKELQTREQKQLEALKIQDPGDVGATCCVNAGCKNFGTAKTSYMCVECFEQQKQRELNCALTESTPRYGTGNSKFYTQADMESHQSIKRLPSVRRLHELDQTLYLSNSTFYNDVKASDDPHPTNRVDMKPPTTPSYRHTYAAPTQKLLTDLDTNRLSQTNRTEQRSDLPLGTASVYSPGRTIIHKIVRQDENLPINGTDTPTPPPTYTASAIVQFEPKPPPGTHMAIATPFVQLQAQPCRTVGCMFYGSANTNFYCSKCCQLAKVTTPAATSQSKILTDV